MTAEGKVSAIILMAMPILMFIYVYFINYDYISLLWIEQNGRYMLTGAIVLQLIGALVIRKIVDVEI